MNLKFYILGQELRAYVPPVMVGDTINYFSAEFVFKDEAWADLTKYAHFQLGEECYDIPLENDAIPESAGLNLQAGEWSMHLHGDRYENGALVQRVTTNACHFTVKESGCLEGSAFPSVSPDLAAELIARVEKLEKSGIAVPLGEPAEEDIPKVFIDGTIPTSKDDVKAVMRYISKTESFDAFIKIKCQGSSSLSYDKKNFTVKLYSDEEREQKQKHKFRTWGEQSKFCLKANYIDHSHARNIVSANLWSEVLSKRQDYDSLPEELRTSPNNGAVDGFPIKLYTNGVYQGIYTWNIPKDAWTFNMDEDNDKHVLLCAETNSTDSNPETASNFRALWEGTDGSDWSIEAGTNSEAVKTSLNALITFVMEQDGEDFKAGIGNHLDIQSAIDYYIHQYVICGLDGLGKNLLLASYDGTKWYCSAYDMDSTFGLWWDGSQFVSAEYKCPDDYQEARSLLWERIADNYGEELQARYMELREEVYSFSNMVSHFERFMDVIGKELYEEDLEIYPDIPCGSSNNIKQIRDYIRDRLAYVDSEMLPKDESELLYSLPEVTVFDGTSSYIDTELMLFDEQKDFTIIADFDSVKDENPVDGTSNYCLFTSRKTRTDNVDSFGIHFKGNNGNYYPDVAQFSGQNPVWEDKTNGNWGHGFHNLDAVAFVFVNGIFSFGKYLKKSDGGIGTITPKGSESYEQCNESLTIGARISGWTGNPVECWKGTMNQFDVYNRALSAEEIDALFTAGA